MDQHEVFEKLEKQLRSADEARLDGLEARYRSGAERGEAEACFALAGVALSRGEPARAEALLRQTAANSGDPAVLTGLGEALAEQGRLVEAEAILKAAAQLRPADDWTLFWLGRARAGLGRPGAAETALARAAQLNPGSPGVHAQLGQAQARRGALTRARDSYTRALQLDPDIDTRITVLGYLSHLNEPVADAYRDLLKTHPDNVRLLYNLAFKAPASVDEPQRRQLECMADSEELAAAQKAAVHYALVGLAQAGGNTEAAITHARQANQAMAAHGAPYDPHHHHRQVTRVMKTFDGHWFETTRGWGSELILPVFIVGMPRSGTSLVEQILASHPGVVGGGELAVISFSLERLPLLMQRSDDPAECLKHVGREEIASSVRFCLESFGDLASGAERVTDKFPDNYLHLGWIRTMFPRASIIHCKRDARDTALSCWLNRLPEVHWSCELEHITTRIEEYRRIMDHWRAVLPGGYLDLDYAKLVSDPETEAKKLLAHCSLDWDPVCLRFHETARSVETASYQQVRKPVYRGSAGRWEHHSELLAPWLKRLGV